MGVYDIEFAVTVFCGILLIAYPFWTLFFLRKNFHKLGEPEFKEKYMLLYEDLNYTSKSALFYPMIFISRRLIIGFLIMNFTAQSSFEIIGMFQINYIYIIYIGNCSPFKSKRDR